MSRSEEEEEERTAASLKSSNTFDGTMMDVSAGVLVIERNGTLSSAVSKSINAFGVRCDDEYWTIESRVGENERRSAGCDKSRVGDIY